MKATLFSPFTSRNLFSISVFSDSAGLSDSYFQRVPRWGGVGGGVGGSGGGRGPCWMGDGEGRFEGG